MTTMVRGIIRCACVLALTCGALAQQTPAPNPTPDVTSPATSTSAPQSSISDRATNTDRSSTAYRLGAGDVLDMRVFGKAQFDGLLEVNEQGTLDVPFVDKQISARCRTLDDIRVEIADALTKYVRNPQISLRLATRRPRPDAIVSGAVRVPQRYQLRRRVRLLELLASSGGVTDQASGTIQIFHTETSVCSDAAPNSSATPTPANSTPANPASPSVTPTSATTVNATPSGTPSGNATPQDSSLSTTTMSVAQQQPTNASGTQAASVNNQTANNQSASVDDGLQMPFSIYDLNELRQGKEAANPFIEPGDVIVVQEAAPVYVTGAVVAPQVVYVRGGGLTLTRALARVGGLKKDAGRSQIRIYRQRARQAEPQVIAVDYDLVRANKQPDIALEAYDVIEVPEASAARVQNSARRLFDLTKAAAGVGSNLPLRVIN